MWHMSLGSGRYSRCTKKPSQQKESSRSGDHFGITFVTI